MSKYLKDIKINRNQIKDSINNFQNEYLLSEIMFNVDKIQNLQIKLEKIKQDINEKGF